MGKDSQQGTMTILTSVSLSWEHQKHRACIVSPLTISPGLGLATLTGCHLHLIVIVTLTAALVLKIRLSHRWKTATFWLQALNTHICESLNTDRRLFLLLRTSVSILQHFPLTLQCNHFGSQSRDWTIYGFASRASQHWYCTMLHLPDPPLCCVLCIQPRTTH